MANGSAVKQQQNVSDLLFPDLLSSELPNGSSNAVPHISDDVTSSLSGNTPQFPGNVHNATTQNVHQQTQQRPPPQPTSAQPVNNGHSAEQSGFEAFDDPFGDDGFGEFETAAPSEPTQTATGSHTVDLLGDLDANTTMMDTAAITEDVGNAEEAEPEDDFATFVHSIKVEAVSLFIFSAHDIL